MVLGSLRKRTRPETTTSNIKPKKVIKNNEKSAVEKKSKKRSVLNTNGKLPQNDSSSDSAEDEVEYLKPSIVDDDDKNKIEESSTNEVKAVESTNVVENSLLLENNNSHATIEYNDREKEKSNIEKNGTGGSSSRLEQKQLRMERKGKKDSFELVTDLKKKWEKLRRISLGNAERSILLKEMTNMVKGHVVEIIFKHDASRVIQSIVKYGTTEYRLMIANELKGKFVELSKSLYGKFLIQRLLKHTPKLRKEIIEEFFKHIPKLVRHLVASYVIEKIYSEYATGIQRYHMLQELYHSEFLTFKTNKPIIELLETRQKEPFQQSLLAAIKPCIEKGILGDLTIVQKAALDYLSIVNEDKQKELLESLHVVAILHTKEGSQLGMRAISQGSAKDRKRIAKEFKGLVMKMCTEEYGHLVAIQFLDTVDDTVLIDQTLLKEIDYKQFETNNYFRRIILFILCGRTTRHFAPSILEGLNQNGKKEPFKRYLEILKISSKQIYSSILPKLIQNLSDVDLGPYCVEVLIRSNLEEEDKSEAVKIISQNIKTSIGKLDRTFTRMVKSIIQYHKHWEINQVKAKVKEGYNEEGHKLLSEEIKKSNKYFTKSILENIGKEVLIQLSITDGAFLALAFLEDNETHKETLFTLKTHIDKIESSEYPGSKLLSEKLKN